VGGVSATDPANDTTGRWILTSLPAAEVFGLPTVRPTLVLDLANARALDRRVSFTRASTATRINAAGLVEVVGANVPRFDHDPSTLVCLGLLREEAGTNMLPYSSALASWSGTIGTITISSNTVVSPTGLVEADALSFSAAGDQRLQTGLSVVAGAPYTMHGWAKLLSGNGSFRFKLHDGVSDLVSGINVATSTWTRFSYTFTSGATSAGGNCALYKESAAGDISFDCLQLEQNSSASSYYPTAGGAATRAAETISIGGSEFAAFFNPLAGTFLAEGAVSRLSATAYQPFFSVNDGTYLQEMLLGRSSVAGDPQFIIVNGGALQDAPTGGGVYVVGTPVRLSAAYAANNFAVCRDGGTVAGGVGTVPAVNRMQLGNAPFSGGAPFSGHIRRIVYWPVRLSNATLKALTA
jgi:hypothetical protein